MESNPTPLRHRTYLTPVSPLQVRLEDNFWRPRQQTLTSKIIKTQYSLLSSTGRLENFKVAAGKSKGSFQGYFFNDSDVYKWLEAAVWAQAQDEIIDAETNKAIEDTIDLIAAAQQPDGYLDTYFMKEKASQRWTNLKDMHEMYCAGHLIQAAVADYRARQGTRLMAVARRLADHICGIFGPGKRPGVPGHPEIELALVDLYRETNHEPYLETARYFIEQRGKGIIGGSPYHLDHKPIQEMNELAGHAVRAMYLCTGASGVVEFSGDTSLFEALTRLWNKMVTTQMYVTGGLGARHEGESFGAAYELPNSRAYTETCAAIGSVMWNHQMLRLTKDPRYADLLEWTLYNAVLPGISLDGDQYFYENPLSDQGTTRRANWFPCACCPPNVARILATYPAYLYATGQSESVPEVYIYGYAQSTAFITLREGSPFTISQKSNYPWDGRIEIFIENCDFPSPINLHLRIPSWVEDQAARLSLNGQTLASPPPGRFALISHTFKSGDHIILELPMLPRWLVSHPFVIEDMHHAALSRGPLVYCLEGVDNPGIELRLVEAITSGSVKQRPNVIDGLVGLSFPAIEYALSTQWQDNLYLPVKPAAQVLRSFEAVAIPYFAWANRQASQMQVWLTSGRNL